MQLILLSMPFLLPIGMVPLAVAAGVLCGSALEYVRGPLHRQRIVLRLQNAWRWVGPAIVLGLAGESCSAPGTGRRLTSIGARGPVRDRLRVDLTFRQRAARGVPAEIDLRAMASVNVIDLGLALIGLAVAFASVESPAGVLLRRSRCRSWPC